jgi:protease-4
MDRRLFYVLIAVYALSVVLGIGLYFRKPVKKHGASKEPIEFANRVFSREAIGIVEVYGPIYVSQKTSGFGLRRDADEIVRTLRKFNERGDVKAVVLRINSPGGSVAAVQEICNEIALLKKNRKVVVSSLGDVAASGGYYIASQTDKIVANPGTLTGSIGVILQTANVKELLQKVGVNMRTIRTGKYKDIGSSFRDLTPEEKKILQDISDEVYTQFVDAIVKGRGMDREKVKSLADGRIYIGTQAKELGLVDELGGSERAIQLAKELSGIRGRPKILRDTNPFDFFERIIGNSNSMKIFSEVLEHKKIRLDYMME